MTRPSARRTLGAQGELARARAAEHRESAKEHRCPLCKAKRGELCRKPGGGQRPAHRERLVATGHRAPFLWQSG